MIKRCACTCCDPVARETVIHTNGENVLDTAAAASVASETVTERGKNKKEQVARELVSIGGQRKGNVKEAKKRGGEDRAGCVNDKWI